ncbi:hypothetical protein V2O64_01445 [Verrucomicrobiaceae bacterium 227]
MTLRHPAVRKTLAALFTGFVTLIAAECLTMVIVSPLMVQNRGWIVFAGLLALPLWGVLLTFAYTVDKRPRFLLALIASSILGVLCLFP